jgi:outer membrane receptor for ferrienterochelin and colicins
MTRRLLAVLFVTLCFATFAAAQQPGGGIQGTVKDETGAALPGATVTASGPASRSASTNGEGKYHLDNLPPGAYKVTVQLTGFGAAEKTEVAVGAGASTELSFTLAVVLRGEEVVVTASKVESTLVNAPATMSVISSETIASTPAQNYGDLLRTVPGTNVIQMSARDINITSRDATATLSNSQLALLDGRSIYLDFFGLILWDFVPSNTAEIKQIEVVRGPASAVWGANALTGVVNIITKTPREAEGANLILNAGTFDRKCDNCSRDSAGTSYGAAFTYAHAINDTWAYKLSGGYFDSDPFSRPTGRIPVIPDPRLSDPKQTVGGAPYPIDKESTQANFGTAFENEGTKQPKVNLRVDQELAGGGRITYEGGYAGTQGLVHTGIGPFNIQSGSYMAHGKVNFTKGALKLNVFSNLVDAEAPNLLAFDPATQKAVQLNFKTQTHDLEVGHSTVVASKHILSYGGNARRNNFDITIAPNSKDRNEFGAYFQDEFFLERFRFAIGGRVDKFGNLSDPVFSPRLLVMFKPEKAHSIRVSFNKAFRSPSTINNFLDQAIVQPVDLRGLAPLLPPVLQPAVATPFPLIVKAVGSDIAIPGKTRPDLREESLTAYEIGYTGTFMNRTTVGAAFYINDKDDNINFTPLPNNFDRYTAANPPPGWTARGLPPILLELIAARGIFLPRTAFTYQNLGPIRTKGFELSVDHSFNREWSASANYSYQQKPEPKKVKAGEDAFPASEISFPPKNRINLAVNYNSKRFLGNASFNHTDEAFWSDVLTGPYFGFTKAFNMVNATFGVKWANGKVVTSLKGMNLANEAIQQHIFGDIMKRSIVGEVRFTFWFSASRGARPRAPSSCWSHSHRPAGPGSRDLGRHGCEQRRERRRDAVRVGQPSQDRALESQRAAADALEAVDRGGAGQRVHETIERVPGRAIAGGGLEATHGRLDLPHALGKLLAVAGAQGVESSLPSRAQLLHQRPLHRSRSASARPAGSKGFGITPRHPSERYSASSDGWTLAVRKTTGVDAMAGSARKAVSALGPSISSITTSIRIRSGANSGATASALRADEQHLSVKPPEASRASEQMARTSASSSTRRMRFRKDTRERPRKTSCPRSLRSRTRSARPYG